MTDIDRGRRRALGALCAGAALAPRDLLAAQARKPAAKLRFGAPDWCLRMGARPEALALAKAIGFDGIQIALGKIQATPDAEPTALKLSDPAIQKQYLAESKRTGITIASVSPDVLHIKGLKSEPIAQKWLADSIPIAKALGAPVILVPFFYKWGLKTQAEMDHVADILRELGPEAEKAGVILGVEDELSAKDNVRILERARSKAVRVYYDVGNSTKHGFDIYSEIPWLGRERICEVHFKDAPLRLREGKIDFRRVVDLLGAIGFDGWVQLETRPATEQEVPAVLGDNLAFVRGIVAEAATPRRATR